MRKPPGRTLNHSAYCISQFKWMNQLGKTGQPFFFMVDFELENPVVIPISELPGKEILFDIGGYRNFSMHLEKNQPVDMISHPITYDEYIKSYEVVNHHLHYGNSFLVNLTQKTKIEIDTDLRSVFFQSTAKYKLLYENRILVFSPEIFVKIRDGKISSYPMKGTIENHGEESAEAILKDPKELAEHVTIVDLIRNDLSMVAKEVEVKRFRYLDEIITRQKSLLQVSSEISGILPKGYPEIIGDILLTLLPAGSVSGAPKPKTMEIIKQSEKEPRGYFTGVFGYFNGRDLDSGVMIRYIEKENDSYYFRSGGGITVNSNPESEYKEMIDKVYVPIG